MLTAWVSLVSLECLESWHPFLLGAMLLVVLLLDVAQDGGSEWCDLREVQL